METLSLHLFVSLVVGYIRTEGTTQGTVFYLVIPPRTEHAKSSGSYVVIMNPTDKDAEISLKTTMNSNIDHNTTVSRYNFTQVDLAKNAFSSGNESLQQHGIKLEVINGVHIEVTVFIQLINDEVETYRILPISALGLIYDVIAPVLMPSCKSLVSFVTVNENTTINITFHNITSVYHFNNINTNVTIKYDQDCMTVRIPPGFNVFTLWYDNPMTGLKLNSDYKIAVFSGCLCHSLVPQTSNGTFILAQVPPTEFLGYNFLVNNVGHFNYNRVILLAASENTTIMSYDNETCFGNNLHKSQEITTSISSPMNYIMSSKPLLIAHILGTESDYFSMYYVTPLDGYLTEYNFYIPDSVNGFKNSSVTIFTCDNTGEILLNKKVINSTDVITSSTIAGDTTCNSSVIRITSDLNTISNGTGVFGGYVYYSKFSRLGVYNLGSDYYTRNETCNSTQSTGTDSCVFVDLECPYLAPEVYIESIDMTAKLNDDVVLHCFVRANPTPSVQWFYNGTIINETASNTRFTVNTFSNGELTNSTLTIISMAVPDSSTYECQATNRLGNDSREILLVLVGDPPLMTVQNLQYRLKNEGEDAKLPCGFTSELNVTDLYWTKSSNENFLNTTGIKYSHGTITYPSLLVRNSTLVDTGVYNCHATNYFGTSKGPDILLIVSQVTVTTEKTTNGPVITTHSPSSTSTTITVVQRNNTVYAGQNITLSVIVNGPIGEVCWEKTQGDLAVKLEMALSLTKASGATIYNPSLTLYNVSAHDEAVYTCVVRYEADTVKSETITLKVLDQTVVTFVYVPEETKLEYLNNKTTALKKELSVDKQKLSSTIRLKTSAPDSRPSAAATGALGIVLLTLTFGTMILLDIPVLIREIRTKSFFLETVVEYCKTLKSRFNKKK